VSTRLTAIESADDFERRMSQRQGFKRHCENEVAAAREALRTAENKLRVANDDIDAAYQVRIAELEQLNADQQQTVPPPQSDEGYAYDHVIEAL
jgi:hypothetical protein